MSLAVGLDKITMIKDCGSCLEITIKVPKTVRVI
jgi:hypothetical protein